MQRTCYQDCKLDGFSSTKVESLAMTLGGTRMFAGTSDGQLLMYECRMENSTYTFSNMTVVRKTKERKASYTSLRIFSDWGVLLGIIDGIITVYDVNTCQCVAQLLDTKGCTMYSVHESSTMLVVGNKRKISFYLWQGSGFMPQREVALNESPKFLQCLQGAVIVGYKKSYEVVSASNYSSTHVVDVDKEHSMVGTDTPASIRRSACVLLSVGAHGVLVENARQGRPNVLREKLEWGGVPVAIRKAAPFNLVSLLANFNVEVHDLASLNLLQTLNIIDSLGGTALPSAATLSLALCDVRKGEEHLFVSTGEMMATYTMIPVANQIMSLTADGHYEDALDLYNLAPNSAKEGQAGLTLEKQIYKIHEMYAHLLHSKGDFDGAMQNFISAKSSPASVLSLLPEFVPSPFQAFCDSAAAQSTSFVKSKAKMDSEDRTRGGMSGSVLARAASAVAFFCEEHRVNATNKAVSAEKLRAAGIGGAAIMKSDQGTTDGTEIDMPLSPIEIDETIKMAELIDTTFLNALISCSPYRKEKAIEILSKANRCHSETSAVLLASRGKLFMEALLWLYRSGGEHRRVLAALTEDRCVETGAWSKDQFYTWVADYLRWLWFSDDASLPPLALQSLKSVLEYDPVLGLTVLSQRPKGKPTFGGKGVTVNEVIIFLSTVTPPADEAQRKALIAVCAKQSAPIDSEQANKNQNQNHENQRGSGSRARAYASDGIRAPPINGASLGISYLEWLVGTGAAPASMHDEYAQLLVNSIPMQSKDVNHAANGLVIADDDSEVFALYKIYRRKLQHFLQYSKEYRAERVAKFLPPDFLHEQALLLSRSGKHEHVLSVYINRLQNIELATSYCDRIYSQSQLLNNSSKTVTTGGGNTDSNDDDAEDSTKMNVYLCLFRVILAAEACVSGDAALDADTITPLKTKNTTLMIRLAEKYFDRFSSLDFLQLIHDDVPVASIATYLYLVIEHTNAKKKNLQVLHQVLRMREVKMRTSANAVGDGF